MAEKVLGRGLADLIVGDSDGKEFVSECVKTPVHTLRACESQPRMDFDQDSLRELSESILANGLLQPITVRRASDGMYEIIAGERRWRAAMMAGVTEVPVMIRDCNDGEALRCAIVENVQRKDLNAVEEASGYRRLSEDYSMTTEEIAKSAGKSRSHVTNMMRILSLPAEVLSKIRTGVITYGHARALIGYDKISEIVERIEKEGLSVRQVENEVSISKDKKNVAVKKANKSFSDKKSNNRLSIKKDIDTVDKDIKELEKMLSDAIGVNVYLSSEKMIIEYSNDMEMLDKLSAALMGLSEQCTELGTNDLVNIDD